MPVPARPDTGGLSFLFLFHSFVNLGRTIIHRTSGSWHLCQRMSVHARPSRDVKDPAKIAIVVAHAAVVPAVVLAYIVGVAAVIDEMVAID